MARKKQTTIPNKTKRSDTGAKPYAMTLVLGPEHKELLDLLKKKLLDTQANILRRSLVEMAERHGVRDTS